MNRKTVVGIALLLALAALGIILFAVLSNITRKNPTAEIYSNGTLIKRVPLSENAEFKIECENGVNIVTIKDGTVSVTYADCPDKICVKQGAIKGGAVPIVCLPHKLEVIVVDGETDTDA